LNSEGVDVARQAWICDGCLEAYNTREAAENCENTHAKKDKIKISALHYVSLKVEPSRVCLKIRDEGYDHYVWYRKEV
jgi:hypothetical protein